MEGYSIDIVSVDRKNKSNLAEVLRLIYDMGLSSSCESFEKGRHLPAPGVYIKDKGVLNFYNPCVSADFDALQSHVENLARSYGNLEPVLFLQEDLVC